MSDLLPPWLAHYDPIHRGYTPRGIANAVCATNGWAFPRVRGGTNLYRGRPSAEAIDLTDPVGAAGRGATTIANFPWRPHGAGQEYGYTLRAIGGGGVESPATAPAVSVARDEAGRCTGGRPNTPAALSVEPAAGGGLVLRWCYSPRGEETSPEQFHIYADMGDGALDYAHPVGNCVYRAGQVHYVYHSPPQVHGGLSRWAVRAVTDRGRNDGNLVTVCATADAAGPAAYPYPSGEQVETG